MKKSAFVKPELSMLMTNLWLMVSSVHSKTGWAEKLWRDCDEALLTLCRTVL